MRLIDEVSINYNPRTYEKDYFNFYINSRKSSVFGILILVLIGAMLISLVLIFSFNGSWGVMGVILLGISLLITLVEIHHSTKYKKVLQGISKTLPKNPEKIFIYKRRIDMTFSGNMLSVFFIEIQSLKRMNNTIFLILKDKEQSPYRICESDLENRKIDSLQVIISERIENVKK